MLRYVTTNDTILKTQTIGVEITELGHRRYNTRRRDLTGNTYIN